mmetsp:Transcript_45994/g.99903  ORF Transcript_45994/g.99903 Transcript_45994/m.99903 type:complete len:346 (+) Transcript_45994:59-1096(+)
MLKVIWPSALPRSCICPSVRGKPQLAQWSRARQGGTTLDCRCRPLRSTTLLQRAVRCRSPSTEVARNIRQCHLRLCHLRLRCRSWRGHLLQCGEAAHAVKLVGLQLILLVGDLLNCLCQLLVHVLHCLCRSRQLKVLLLLSLQCLVQLGFGLSLDCLERVHFSLLLLRLGGQEALLGGAILQLGSESLHFARESLLELLHDGVFEGASGLRLLLKSARKGLHEGRVQLHGLHDFFEGLQGLLGIPGASLQGGKVLEGCLILRLLLRGLVGALLLLLQLLPLLLQQGRGCLCGLRGSVVGLKPAVNSGVRLRLGSLSAPLALLADAFGALNAHTIGHGLLAGSLHL